MSFVPYVPSGQMSQCDYLSDFPQLQIGKVSLRSWHTCSLSPLCVNYLFMQIYDVFLWVQRTLCNEMWSQHISQKDSSALLDWLQMLEYKWQPWESFNCWLHVNFIRFWQFICRRCRSPNKSSEPCHRGTINITQKLDRGQLLHPLEQGFFIIQHKRAAPL